MNWIELVPALGKDYSNQKQVREAWNAGEDFRDSLSGSYANKADVTRLGLKATIRYAKLQKVMAV